LGFQIGQIKHHVQLDENGWVASEGVLIRLDREEFVYTAGSCDWLLWQFSRGSWDAEVTDLSPDQTPSSRISPPVVRRGCWSVSCGTTPTWPPCWVPRHATAGDSRDRGVAAVQAGPLPNRRHGVVTTNS
jgi:hypothetical protein